LTEAWTDADLARLRDRTLSFYYAAAILMLVGLGALTVYVLRLGNLTGPGVEQSFGFAVALMFLMSAMMIHLIDRTYRVWPLGRRVQTPYRGAINDRDWAIAIAVVILVAAGASIAYIVAGLIS
jgi:hypothetical protein